jgi:hypothetical protein
MKPKEHDLPLTDRRYRENVIHQMRRSICHTSSATRRTPNVPLTTEGHNTTATAGVAVNGDEAVGRDAALEE